jgi:hypothetical protein
MSVSSSNITLLFRPCKHLDMFSLISEMYNVKLWEAGCCSVLLLETAVTASSWSLMLFLQLLCMSSDVAVAERGWYVVFSFCSSEVWGKRSVGKGSAISASPSLILLLLILSYQERNQSVSWPTLSETSCAQTLREIRKRERLIKLRDINTTTGKECEHDSHKV